MIETSSTKNVRVLLVGSHDWSDTQIIFTVMWRLPVALGSFINPVHITHPSHLVIVNSKEDRGASKLIRWSARELGYSLDEFDLCKDGKFSEKRRNFQMLGIRVDKFPCRLGITPRFVVGFHNNIKNSTITRHCLNQAFRYEGLNVSLITKRNPQDNHLNSTPNQYYHHNIQEIIER